MDMKKVFFLSAFLLALTAAGFAQSDYKSAIGGRIGTGRYDLISGSYKFFVAEPSAIEINAGFGTRGYYSYNTGYVSAAASYQHHFKIPVDGLRWFVGGGAMVYNAFSKYDDYDGFGAGLFPTGGIDYKFSKIPLNLSADIRPTFLIARPHSDYNDVDVSGGISVRYTLGSR
jgi:hypothetical protein